MKKVFISYSRKNDQDIFEFRSQEKNREFEILIDDEDLKFDAPWKQSIIKKITEADAAILFISNDALKPESPIRTLELPLIAKRIRDENDNFIFFPIFLEEVDEETLENYEFTIDGTNEKVNFLDFFQVLDITKQNKLKEARRRARNNFFRDINGNISASLKGEGIFSNVLEISRIRQKQRAQSVGIVFAITLSLFIFVRTDSFARIIINAAERLQPEDVQEGNNIVFNALANQLSSFDNIEELGADDSLIKAIEEVQDLNLDLDLNLDDLAVQNTEDFNATISEEPTTTTTVAPTTTTTVAPTTTTTVAVINAPPTIYKVTISHNPSTITAFYNDATSSTGLNIVGHGCWYSTIPDRAAGGTSTQSPSNSCSLSFPIEYGTVSIKVKQSFEGQVSCGEGCYTDNWSDWSNTITVNLETGSISDSSVQLIYDIPDPGPGCYPDTYPKNRGVNNVLLPFTEADLRQNLLDYGNSYGRLCGDDLVNAYVNHWKGKTADDIKALYPSWSESELNIYLNGSGSGNSWDTGWYSNWNSTPLSTTTTTTTIPDTYVPPILSNFGVSWVGDGEVCLSWGYQRGWIIDSNDQTTWVKMSSKTYFNDQLVYQHSPPLGTPNNTGSLLISVTDGVSYTIRTEIYDRDDQLVQNHTWNTGDGSPFIPGQSQSIYPNLYYKDYFSPAQSDPSWYPSCS